MELIIEPIKRRAYVHTKKTMRITEIIKFNTQDTCALQKSTVFHRKRSFLKKFDKEKTFKNDL